MFCLALVGMTSAAADTAISHKQASSATAAVASTIIKVSDFGAVGDGKTDDGPAMVKAFAAAKADDGPSTVVLENKIYRLGDNPTAWHYFQLIDHEDLVIEGNGATLLCSEGNLAFFFDGGRNISIRGITLDVAKPTFTQGEVVALGENDSFDLKIMDGYPEPPDEAFMAANGYRAHGGGGRHAIVFENGGHSRNTQMPSDHLYIRTITRISPGVFRFHVKEDYLRHFTGMAVGNWVSYGFNGLSLPASVVAAKNKSASLYAQIAAYRVNSITVEDVAIHGSLNGGICLTDMPGDVTIRQVKIIRKPGTHNLLSTISDALHLMNVRGRMLIENCEVESPGDDCLNLGTMLERLVRLSETEPKTMTLRTLDHYYYYHLIRTGDRLQFFNTATKKILGEATVTNALFKPKSRMQQVTLEREIPGLSPETTQVINLDQTTQSTIIRNNTFTPYMRNALLARARNMTIANNKIDCSRGGVTGLNMSYAAGGDGARCQNVRIVDNTFSCPASTGIVLLNPYQGGDDMANARNIHVIGNTFEVGSAKALKFIGVTGLSIQSNHFTAMGKPIPNPSEFIQIRNCKKVVTEHGNQHLMLPK
jgi:hypothetical protein